jgi:hypothetical protein
MRAAAQFNEARADWAKRNARSISSSITNVQNVIVVEPAFTPASAALALCYVLAHVFASAPEAETRDERAAGLPCHRCRLHILLRPEGVMISRQKTRRLCIVRKVSQ